MINLGTLLKIEVIHVQHSARGGRFYEPQAPGFSAFQSASNTILEMSRKLH